MDIDFGPMGTLVAGIASIAALVQLGLFVLLVVVLFDLRAFLREGTAFMRRADRHLARKEHSN